MKEQYEVKRLDRPVDWTVDVPGSKSMTNRALLMAALSDGEVKLEGVLFSDDSRHFLESLVSLGFMVDINESEKAVTVLGCGGNIPKKQAVINVGSAGTAARFLTAMLGFSDGEYTIEASEQMKKRPMQELFSLLTGVGANITYLETEGHLPVKICGRRNPKAGADQSKADGNPLQLSLDISKSTQFLSALLLISPMIPQGLDIHITSEKTDGSYIRITRKMLADAGVEVKYGGKNYRIDPKAVYQKKHYQIEPDVSAACYFYAECDRLHAMSEELTKRGITCTEEPDAITIKPGIPSAGIVSTYEDHRVAMSFALLGLKVDGIVIDNPSCCSKTFENYFDLLDQLSGKDR